MYIGVAQNWIYYKRDAAYDGIDCLRTLQRVAFVAQQQVGLELYEVGLMFFDILTEVGCRMFARERVGIVAIRQEQHFKVHSLREQHVGSTHSRMDASRITVVQQSDIGREAMEYVYLMNRECRARVCHYILYATLVH